MNLFQLGRAVDALLLAIFLTLLPACGAGSPPAIPEPFTATFPEEPWGGPPPDDDGPVPVPEPPLSPVFDADAYAHERILTFGSFPSDVLVYDETLFTSDADQIDADGARVVPIDVSSSSPRDSTEYETVVIHATDLRDSLGGTASLQAPVGYGFFVNDLEIVRADLGFALVNAGGSDSTPLLSNLVAFNPANGTVLQVVNLANRYPAQPEHHDSMGNPVPAAGFLQSGAEAIEFVGNAAGGRLHVAMSNLLFLPPSRGAVKYPGTVQVYDVVPGVVPPVRARPVGSLATETLDVGGFNPVALHAFGGSVFPYRAQRLLVTVAGATAFDAAYNLVPVTSASVAAFDGDSGAYLGRFQLGLTGLSANRPAIGYDAAGHRVGFFPSAVTGEVYLLRLDGLDASPIDDTRVEVLRGPNNGIPIRPDLAGSPGGHLAGIGLAPDGRTLVVASFGDLFAQPQAIPGRLYLLGLPSDVVTGASFGVNFVPGSSLYGTVPGRTLGALALVANVGSRPDVYVGVSSPFDPFRLLATGPASLGSLQTHGLIR